MGPFPIQPVVVRSGLCPELKEALRTSLLAASAEPRTRRALAAFDLERFVPVTYEDYAPERLTLLDREGKPSNPIDTSNVPIVPTSVEDVFEGQER